MIETLKHLFGLCGESHLNIFTIILSIIILNERISTTQVTGLILILAGLILVDGRVMNFFKR